MKHIKEFIEIVFYEIPTFVEQNNLEIFYYGIVITCALIFGVGYISAWFITQRRYKAEIKKLDIETKGKRLTLLKDIQAYRARFIENSELINIIVTELIESLKDRNIKTLETKWNELNDFFFNKLYISFDEYQEGIEIYFEKDRQKLIFFVDDEIFRLYRTVKLFLNTVNHPTILKNINKQKVNISRETLNSSIHFARKNIKSLDIRRHKILLDYLKEFSYVNHYYSPITYWIYSKISNSKKIITKPFSLFIKKS